MGQNPIGQCNEPTKVHNRPSEYETILWNRRDTMKQSITNEFISCRENKSDNMKTVTVFLASFKNHRICLYFTRKRLHKVVITIDAQYLYYHQCSGNSDTYMCLQLNGFVFDIYFGSDANLLQLPG